MLMATTHTLRLTGPPPAPSASNSRLHITDRTRVFPRMYIYIFFFVRHQTHNERQHNKYIHIQQIHTIFIRDASTRVFVTLPFTWTLSFVLIFDRIACVLARANFYKHTQPVFQFWIWIYFRQNKINFIN